MQKLTDYMRQRLTIAGWEIQRMNDNDLFARQSFSPNQAHRVWVFYADKSLTPEEIRRCFEFDGYMLFVVDSKLIPDITARDTTPMWLRILHGLYLGRVYTWNGKGINGLHFDYDQGEIKESGYISIDDLALEETGTWLKGWTGTYKLAFCGDRPWWAESNFHKKTWQNFAKESPNPKTWEDMFTGKWTQSEQPPAGNSSARQQYEQGRDWYWEQMRKRTGQAPGDEKPPNGPSGTRWEGGTPHWGFRYRDSNNNWSYTAHAWEAGSDPFTARPNPPPPKQEAPKRDLFSEFMACASLADARRMWKKLLLENHPDKFIGEPDKVAAQTALTQEINAAYQKAERYLK